MRPGIRSAAAAIGFSLFLVSTGPGFAGVSVRVDPSAAVNGNLVTVTGTVMCPTGRVVTIAVHMVQQQSQLAALAKGEVKGIPCTTGQASPWTVTATSDFQMGTGPANLLAGAWACTPAGIKPTGPCDFAFFNGEITLK